MSSLPAQHQADRLLQRIRTRVAERKPTLPAAA
jgi:hypothetical protein